MRQWMLYLNSTTGETRIRTLSSRSLGCAYRGFLCNLRYLKVVKLSIHIKLLTTAMLTNHDAITSQILCGKDLHNGRTT